jgi:tetratricopeptide (TPR) repeat protein
MPQHEKSAEPSVPSRTPPANPGWVEFPVAPAPASPEAAATESLARLQRALNAIHSGQLTEAIGDLEACLDIDPESPEACFYLACVEHRRRNSEQARAWYEKTIRIAPLAWQPLFNLALIAAEQRNEAEARLLLERAALLGPEVAEVRWRLAILCETSGDEPEARHWFESVLRLDPEHVGARFRLGMIALRAGDIDLAALHLEACQAGHPDAALAAYHLGLCHFQATRWKEARAALDRAHQAQPQCPEFLIALAALALAENDLDRAERHERELHELGHLSAELSFNLARAWFERGQPERARRHYKHAVLRDPSLAHGYFR